MVGLNEIAALMGQGAADPRPDGELLTAYLAHRDQDAFAQLVARHAQVVWGVCRRVLRNPADAEEAFQATFVVLARSGHRVPNRDATGGWLCGVALRVARKGVVMAARRRKREERAARPEGDIPREVIDSDLPEVLNEELGRLSEKDRLAIVLCDLEGLTQRAAAAQLGWTEGTLSSRLHRARRRLADRLRARGVAGAVVTGGSAGVARSAVPHGLLVATVTAVHSGPGAEAAHGLSAVERLAQAVLRDMTTAVVRRVMTAVLLVGVIVVGGLWPVASPPVVAAPPLVRVSQMPAEASPVAAVDRPVKVEVTPAMLYLVTKRDVLRELGCTAEQRVDLDDHADAQAAERERDLAVLFAVIRQGSKQSGNTPQEAWEELETRSQIATTARREKVATVLTGDQLVRLVQVELQTRGVAAFADQAVAKALQLTDAQRRAVTKELSQPRQDGPKAVDLYDGPDGKGVRLAFDGAGRVEACRAIEAGLTDAQRAAWRKLGGEPVGFDRFAPR